MDEKELKSMYEVVIKEILGDKKPTMKIDVDMEKLVPNVSIEIHESTPEILGMMFMEVFAEIHDHLKFDAAKEEFHDALKMAVDIYAEDMKDLPEPADYIDTLKEGDS